MALLRPKSGNGRKDKSRFRNSQVATNLSRLQFEIASTQSPDIDTVMDDPCQWPKRRILLNPVVTLVIAHKNDCRQASQYTSIKDSVLKLFFKSSVQSRVDGC